MCSINGFTWQDESRAAAMNRVTAHRGPDGTGVFSVPQLTLGHNRLSIIDLSEQGGQPMKSKDGRFVISFNGEIYNYRELKQEIGAYPWQSESDTEVILAGYAKWGKNLFAKLHGIFACALWDAREEELLLVRDPVGVKPLYYHIAPADSSREARLVFSSEIKALLVHEHIDRRIDPVAFDIYMRVLYVPAPHTMFAGVNKLLPGHILSWKRGAHTLRPFISVKRPALSSLPFREQKEHLRTQVERSVKAQLVSDRPVGLYLSGGIDSNAVLSCMAAATGSVESFSVGFELKENEQPEKFNADFYLARSAAKRFGTKHHEFMVKPEQFLPLFEEAIFHMDEPSANPTIVPMLALAREAKRSVAVVLGGDGGDELFGGYERYRLSLLSSLYRRFPEALRKIGRTVAPSLRKLDTAPGIDRFAQFLFVKEDILAPLLVSEWNRPQAPRDFFSDAFFADIREPFETAFMETDRKSWLVDESLLRSDKLSMAGGLELRVPLLHIPLIDTADTIPLSHKVSFSRTKIILKEAFRDCLDPKLLSAPKRGWFSPGAKWLRHPEVSHAAREILSPDYAPATKALFQWGEVQRRLEGHLRGEYHATTLFAIIGLQVWARAFKVR